MNRTANGTRTAVMLLLLAASSCRLLQGAVEVPGKVLEGSKRHTASAAEVQSDVMRFADRLDSAILQATHDFAAKVGTNEARIQALGWSIRARTSALTIACGPNPNLSLLDMVVLVTLGRMVHEEHWVPEVWGEADRPMVDAYRELEGQIWEIAKESLSQKQLDQVHAMIEAWRKDNPGQVVTGSVRLSDFEHLLASRQDKESNVFQELGQLLSMDPLAGLEPTKREVAQARLLGERVLFYAQRAPLIFSAQAELLGLKMSEELSRQREGLVQNLESTVEPVGKVLGEARSTAEAAKEMSNSVQSAIETLDKFVASAKSGAGGDRDQGTPSRPFDVREYGDAAARVSEAAKGLDGLITDVQRNEAQTARLLDTVQERTDRTIARASNRLLVVGLILIAAGAAAVLLVRGISARWRSSAPRARAPGVRSAERAASDARPGAFRPGSS